MKPTAEQIQKMIFDLREILPRVRHRSRFGDDNHAAIFAQVSVLEKGMNEDDVYDEWPESEEDLYERDAALEALHWMEGLELEEGLLDDWQSLAKGES